MLPAFRLSEPRTWIAWLVIIGVIWWVIQNPSEAALDVHKIGHALNYGISRVAAFLGSVFSGQ